MNDDDDFFHDVFQEVHNINDIPEADDFSPEVLEDTCVNMEVALP
jgi:hypothetical protein